MEIKEYDVFSATWVLREWGDQKDHCFEGLLVAKYSDKVLMLFDTFWNIDGSGGECYTIEKANELFSLIHYTNLNDIEPIGSFETDEYADEDIIILHRQHACSDNCRYFYRKKGAEKNVNKKIMMLVSEREGKTRKITSLISDIENITAQITRLQIKGFSE